jgi:hypothetical protein
MRARMGLFALALLAGLSVVGPASAQAPGLQAGSLGMTLNNSTSKITGILPSMTPLKNVLNWLTNSGSNQQYTTVNAPAPYQIDTAAYQKQFGIYRPQRLHLGSN